ncbi:Ferric-chelate reductase 1 [Orchesella cincta]|uniref:Ferric-chelate reductase 1 n=1 Tax=Orchesella cincta TaxID=48709 RepID=A0A1D2M7F6_ORCCI|nr:Ferric-chelate reductase 1 [Orchesella cincta]
MIKLKKESLGGWGYFQSRYIRDKDVNCHKDIPEIDPYFEVVENYPKGRPYARLPPRKNLIIDENYRDIDGPNEGELEDYMTPGRFAQAPAGYYCNEGVKYGKTWAYIANNPQDPVRMALKDVWNDPVVVQNYYGAETKATEYFGTRHSRASEATPTDVPEQWREELSSSLKEMVQRDNTRCPCPFVPTTEEPELQTKAPVEVQARHLHVVNMLIAWIILVPLAFFVSRYYKETFSKVFFLQEFWWYTIHVLALLTALLFMVGSFYSMHLRREGSDYKTLWTDATTIHIYFGYTLVCIFIIHLFLGPFRFWDRDLREMQIRLHWGFGWAEYILAAFTFASAAGMPQGLMNCESFCVYVAFLFFQVLFYAIMKSTAALLIKDWIWSRLVDTFLFTPCESFIRMLPLCHPDCDAHRLLPHQHRFLRCPSHLNRAKPQLLLPETEGGWSCGSLLNYFFVLSPVNIF